MPRCYAGQPRGWQARDSLSGGPSPAPRAGRGRRRDEPAGKGHENLNSRPGHEVPTTPSPVIPHGRVPAFSDVLSVSKDRPVAAAPCPPVVRRGRKAALPGSPGRPGSRPTSGRMASPFATRKGLRARVRGGLTRRGSGCPVRVSDCTRSSRARPMSNLQEVVYTQGARGGRHRVEKTRGAAST
jgi:hypothetical protein